MRKSIILIGIFIISIPLLVSGCTKIDNVVSNSEVNQPSANNQPSSVPNETQQFQITKSEKIPGWNKLKAKVNLYRLEKNKEGMSWSSLPDNKTTTFSLDFPNNWVFNGASVFNDQKDSKVAEIVPVAQANITLDELFQSYQPSLAAGEELISKELFDVNGYKGLRIISKVPVYAEKPFWFPHIYYISNDSYIFGMMLYSFENDESGQQLFEKIISTFRFEDEGMAPS